MLDQLSHAEQRKIVLASRLHFSPEFTTPRKNAAEAILENALYLTDCGRSVSATEVLAILADLAGIAVLRCLEVEDRLKDLVGKGRVLQTSHEGILEFKLSPQADQEIAREYENAASQLDRVVTRLYGSIPFSGPRTSLTAVLTDALCHVFSALGSQWASYVTGTPIRQIIDADRLEKIIDGTLAEHKVPSTCRSDIKRATIKFFRNSDPDFNQVKFAFGQNMYVIQLLGMDGCDLLSQEAFRNAQLYLDSSVVIPALLGGSRHYRVFHELLRICSELNIQVLVSRPTIDEVRNVAAIQEQLAPSVYDLVPDGLAKSVKGDFFQTYRAQKSTNPAATFADVFSPFHELSSELESLNIRVVDDERFEQFRQSGEVELVMETLQSSSLEHRKRIKFKNALVHDAVMFRYIRSITEANRDEKIWFVTRDISLPHAWSKFQTDRTEYRCFLLDGLLQAIAPFVSQTAEVDVSELFSQVVAMQILPQARLFDVDDFMVFRDLEIDCREMDEGTVQEALFRIKRQVLKGATYNRANLEDAAYELRRIFAQRKQNAAAWTHDREKLESSVLELNGKIAEMQESNRLHVESESKKHQSQVDALRSQLEGLMNESARSAAQHDHEMLQTKRCSAGALALFVLFVLVLFALSYGEGSTWFSRLISFRAWFLPSFVFWWLATKLLFFRDRKFKDVFPTIADMLELLK